MARAGALLVALAVAAGVRAGQGAIHKYHQDYFYSVGNAFIFRGGREGMYASTEEVRFRHST